MTIKQQGGIFGRNPAFNNIEATNLDVTNIDAGAINIIQSGSTSGTLTPEYATLNIDGGAGASGLHFAASSLLPRDNGDYQDAGVDLGTSSYRFRSAFLSGGVYLGGTVAANNLDDYEEGSFTPNVEGTTTAGAGTYNSRVGLYTKVGNRVMFNLWINMAAHTGSGNMAISGLPYISGSGTRFHTLNGLYSSDITAPSGHVIVPMIFASTTSILMYSNPTGTTGVAALALDTAFTINISGQYETA